MNEDKRDNRKQNLRLIPWSHNNYHKNVRKNRTTGIRGVSRYANGSFVALIGLGGKRKSFRTMEEAIRARKKFERSMHLGRNRIVTYAKFEKEGKHELGSI